MSRATTGTAPAGASVSLSRLADWAAPVLILLIPFVNFLRHHDYGFWQAESLVCMALIVALGLALSALAALRPSTLRHALIALLLTVFLDHQLGGQEAQQQQLMQWGVGLDLTGAIQNAAFPVAFVLILAVTWPVRANLGLIVTTVFGVMLLAGIVLPRQSPSAVAGPLVTDPGQRADLPPVVHLILDEQIGTAGLPLDVPGGRELRAELRDFYRRHGFRLFGRAYSPYSQTIDSLGSLLNGEAEPRRGGHISAVGQRQAVAHNGWFRTLSDRGYRIRVYQTDFLDFCADPEVRIESCLVYPFSGLPTLAVTDVPVADKVRLLFENLLFESFINRVIAGIDTRLRGGSWSGEGLPPAAPWHWDLRRLGPLSASTAMDRLVSDIRAAEPGTAYFAHLLLPHFAYVFDRHCRVVQDPANWLNNAEALVPSPFKNTEATRSARYERYFEQVRCLHKRFAEILETLDGAGLSDRAIVILHGDHGSRISRLDPMVENVEHLSDADLLDSFSTLFAVRYPGLEAGYDETRRSIHGLFAELLLQRPLPQERGEVYLFTKARQSGARLVAQPMAGFE
jgi:hypothetical protein